MQSVKARGAWLVALQDLHLQPWIPLLEPRLASWPLSELLTLQAHCGGFAASACRCVRPWLRSVTTVRSTGIGNVTRATL